MNMHVLICFRNQARGKGGQRGQLKLSIPPLFIGRLANTFPRNPLQKLEKKDRSKLKKIHRAEAAMKLESAIPVVAVTSTCTSSGTCTPAETVIPVIHSEFASSSESDASNGGIEADTEESMTSEEEPENKNKRSIGVIASSEGKEHVPSAVKDKWIAVKGQQHHGLQPQASSSSSPCSSSAES